MGPKSASTHSGGSTTRKRKSEQPKAPNTVTEGLRPEPPVQRPHATVSAKWTHARLPSSLLRFAIRRDVLLLLLFASFLRLVLRRSAGEWLEERPELATPVTAIDRLREGILLDRELGDAYAGDRVHVQPLIIRVASLAHGLVSNDDFVFALFVALDCLSGLFFAGAARLHAAEGGEGEESIDRKGIVALKWFVLNPLAMATCSSLSIAVLYVLLAASFTLAFFARSSLVSVLILSLWTQLSLYPLLLLAPLLSQMRRHSSMVLICLGFVACTAAFFAANYALVGSSKFADSTYAFAIRVDDLTPTVGIFWYFFTEIFEHFRHFFLILFQLNLVIYIVPLVITLRNVPHLNLVISYALLAVFVPYPSLADATVFFALLPFIEEKYRENLRLSLLAGCSLLVCVALMPVMWHLWIVSGSGNANFYFAVTLFYNVSIIQLAIDVVYGYLRKDLEERCPEDVPNKKTLLIFD